MKKSFKPGTMLNPVPVVMVSCGNEEEQNIITIAWTGIVNSEPPMTYVSVRKSRHSHGLISQTGEFVINLVTGPLTLACDYCGVKSGRDVNKFKEMNLTPEKASVVSCPIIGESPVNLECKVVEVHEYPTHDMFVAEIVNVNVDESLLDEKGKIDLREAGLTAYVHGEYLGVKKHPIGRFGFSIMKPKTKKRLDKEEHERRIAKNREKREDKKKAKAEKSWKPEKKEKAERAWKKEKSEKTERGYRFGKSGKKDSRQKENVKKEKRD